MENEQILQISVIQTNSELLIAEKSATNKIFLIFLRSASSFGKLTAPFMGKDHQVSSKSVKNCRFFPYSNFSENPDFHVFANIS